MSGSNYVRNQVQLIEVIFGKKLEGDDLTDLFGRSGRLYCSQSIKEIRQ